MIVVAGSMPHMCYNNKRSDYVNECYYRIINKTNIMTKSKSKKAFTLIELLIVISIIAVISAVVFVTLDPLSRFADTRDARRWSEASAVLSAIKIDQVDNGGAYLTSIGNMVAGEVYMVTNGSVGTGCADQNTYCDTDVTADTNCVDLSGLASEGYLGDVPISPDGSGEWSASSTGYTLQRNASGIVTVRACESENTSEIWVAR